MAAFSDIIAQCEEVDGHRPWPRFLVTADEWKAVAGKLAAGQATLLGLWGDTDAVHMAAMNEAEGAIAVFTLECRDGTFPSVGALHLPAIRLERAVRSLYGLEPTGAPDLRPWLDLGFWGVQHPLGKARPSISAPPPYPFLPAEGDGGIESLTAGATLNKAARLAGRTSGDSTVA
jgi:Ni,Fe-hydrogenase III component G